MYKNVCRHCNAEIEVNSAKSFSNHVRWCAPDSRSDVSKYSAKCSCIECKREVLSSNLSSHIDKHDRGREVKCLCLICQKQVFKTTTKFCSQSCAAVYGNKRSDKVKTRCGPEKGRFGPTIAWHLLQARLKEDYKNNQESPRPFKLKELKPVAYAEQTCKVCSSVFQKKSTSEAVICSNDCRVTILSKNRGRHKRSYMETSFSAWLDSSGISYETEKTFKNLDTGKWYFVDFLFENRKLIIELDGAHHEATKEQDSTRDIFFSSIGYRVVRITHKEYQNKSRAREICDLLDIDKDFEEV